MRVFVVVAKNKPDLFLYFQAGLAGVEHIEVILDRRIGEPPVGTEGSDRERRTARNIYEELSLRGFIIVRIS